MVAPLRISDITELYRVTCGLGRPQVHRAVFGVQLSYLSSVPLHVDETGILYLPFVTWSHSTADAVVCGLQVIFMRCGHPMHQACHNTYVKTNYICPVCNKSLFTPEGTCAYSSQISNVSLLFLRAKVRVGRVEAYARCHGRGRAVATYAARVPELSG